MKTDLKNKLVISEDLINLDLTKENKTRYFLPKYFPIKRNDYLLILTKDNFLYPFLVKSTKKVYQWDWKRRVSIEFAVERNGVRLFRQHLNLFYNHKKPFILYSNLISFHCDILNQKSVMQWDSEGRGPFCSQCQIDVIWHPRFLQPSVVPPVIHSFH